MKPTRVVVTRGLTVTSPDGKAWSKAEYSLEFEVENPTEAQVAKVEAEATVAAWLAAFTMAATGPAGEPGRPPQDADALAAEALIRATPMEGKPGRWLWSKNEPELKAALLGSSGKMSMDIDGKTWDVKLGDGRDERDAFISFWPRRT